MGGYTHTHTHTQRQVSARREASFLKTVTSSSTSVLKSHPLCGRRSLMVPIAKLREVTVLHFVRGGKVKPNQQVSPHP